MVARFRSIPRLLPLALGAALAACKSVEVPKVPGVTPYRMVIQQGNYVSPEMVAQLKVGMTKEQVRYVLGTPLLTDIFHADRWDYVFYREMPNGKREQRNLSVIFENDKLARVIGDILGPESLEPKAAETKPAAEPGAAKPAAATPATEAKPAAESKPAAEAAKAEQPAAPKGTTQNWRAASDIEAEKARDEAAGKATVSADEPAKKPAANAQPADGKSEAAKPEEGKPEEAKKERGFFGRLLEKIGL
ncbi:MAG TPA: outer membrane protein assembly factor BamE [Burkholderiales bacterium]|nr:outer membrane protein assembly factor BamE [Burkholderiales bacterium]